MTMRADDSPRPKIAFWRTVGDAYSAWFSGLPAILQISWIWCLLVPVLAGLMVWQQLNFVAHVGELARSGRPPSLPAGLLLTFAGVIPVHLLAIASIAIAWLRRLMLAESPGLSGQNLFRGYFWRTIGTGFLLTFGIWMMLALAAVPSAVLIAVQKQTGAWTIPIAVILLIGVYITALAVILRLQMVLVARAIGDASLTFARAWRSVQGNTWRLLWGMVVCMLPPMYAMMFVAISLVHVTPLPPHAGLAEVLNSPLPGQLVTMMAILSLWNLLILPIGAGFIGLAYRQIFGAATVSETQ